MNKTVHVDIRGIWPTGHRKISVGDVVILVTDEYVGPSNCHFRAGAVNTLLFPLDMFPEGVPGNCNTRVCRFSGWRGTTDDWCRMAEGVWTVVSMSESRYNDYTDETAPGVYAKKTKVVMKKVQDAAFED